MGTRQAAGPVKRLRVGRAQPCIQCCFYPAIPAPAHPPSPKEAAEDSAHIIKKVPCGKSFFANISAFAQLQLLWV